MTSYARVSLLCLTLGPLRFGKTMKNYFSVVEASNNSALSLTYPASTMDGAACSSSDARKKQRGEPSRQRTLDSYAPNCPSELAYAKDASA